MFPHYQTQLAIKIIKSTHAFNTKNDLSNGKYEGQTNTSEVDVRKSKP